MGRLPTEQEDVAGTLRQALSRSKQRSMVLRQARRPRSSERVVLSGSRALLWAAGHCVPLCAALTRTHVQLRRHVAYRAGRGHEGRLDVYAPAKPAGGPLPALLYVHGGAFTICSKETHWLFAQAFARAGFVVFNINYRLAPEHPFPAALQDTVAAYEWVADHGHEFGADPDRLVLAGESAGANLVTGLALMGAVRRPEPWARRIFEHPLRPRAVVASCGLLEVSRPERFRALGLDGEPSRVLHRIRSAYLPEPPRWEGEHDLADPVSLLERTPRLDRTLPPFFVPCGDRDPLLEDSRRLARALDRHGVHHEAHTYPGEVHAFHAMLWREAAQRCWLTKLHFLESCLALSPAATECS